MKCLYRSWMHNGEKMQACICGDNSKLGSRTQELNTGETVKVIDPDARMHTYQVINCKYPECL